MPGHPRLTSLLAALVVTFATGAPRAGADGPSAIPPRLDATWSPAARAEKSFLEHLGWRFVVDPRAARVTPAGGSPCRRATLAEAQAAGDLRILVPPTVSAADLPALDRTLAEIADSIPSRCAWQHRVAPAVERATAKLSANATRGRWVFPTWAGFNAPVFSQSPPEASWVRQDKRIYHARGTPSAAIEGFYGDEASTECYVGQIVASYAIQYELYGSAWFDATFAPEEIAIGQVAYFHGTPLGKAMNAPAGYPWRALFLRPDDDDENWGVVLARIGPLAFPGLSGILMDQNGSGRSRQNFTFVSVSPAAAASLERNGGFVHVRALTAELLALAKSIRGPFVTGDELVAMEARRAEILADPAIRDVRVYIHPLGVRTLSSLFEEFCREGRTADELILYDEAREDTFFQRYRAAWKARVTTPRVVGPSPAPVRPSTNAPPR